MADSQTMALISAIEGTPAPSSAGKRLVTPSRQDVLDAAAAIGVLAVFAFFVVPQAGGQRGPALVIGLVSTTLGILVTRAWLFLRPSILLLLASLPAAALLVCVLSPSGAAGFRSAAGYAYAAATFAFVAAFARTPHRRTAVALAICALGVHQFAMSLLPWFGGADAGRKMVGTFFWHNQFGAYMAACSLIAGVLGALGAGVLRRVGVLVAPVLASTVLLSASRGSLLFLMLGWAAVGVLAAVQHRGAGWALGRWALMALAVVAVSSALTSPMFFPPAGAGSGLTAVERRNTEQAVEGNLEFRVAHNRAAIAVFAAKPVAGTGFEGYSGASSRHLPLVITRSPWPHNGYLQAAADGGVLLALPLLLAVGAAVVTVLRSLLRGTRSLAARPAQTASAVAALMLLGHSAVDIDWTYPALSALTAAALAAGLPPRGPSAIGARSRSKPSEAVLASLLVTTLLLSITGLLLWRRTDRQLRAVPDSRSEAVVARLATRGGVIPDGRLAERALSLAVPGEFAGRLNVGHDVAKLVFERSERVARANSFSQLQRAQVLVALGRRAEGVALARAVAAREAPARPLFLGELAETLAAGGAQTEAVDVLITGLRDDRLVTEVPRQQLSILADSLEFVAGPDPSPQTDCVLVTARAHLRSAAKGLADAVARCQGLT